MLLFKTFYVTELEKQQQLKFAGFSHSWTCGVVNMMSSRELQGVLVAHIEDVSVQKKISQLCESDRATVHFLSQN